MYLEEGKIIPRCRDCFCKNIYMKKNEKIGVAIAASFLLLVIVGGYYFTHWLEIKAYKISVGLCEPRFPYRDRIEGDLARLFPQVRYADVATRTTPEQTYEYFRDGLRTNDLNKVLDQLDKNNGRYQQNVDSVKKAYKEGKFVTIFKSYPEKLTKDWVGDTIASYYYVEKENNINLRQSMSFRKDKNGDWKMSSL